MKYCPVCDHKHIVKSRPARGGWIEITVLKFVVAFAGPAPQGAGGLKCLGKSFRCRRNWSRPARGGWIEMPLRCGIGAAAGVPPRKGRVD